MALGEAEDGQMSALPDDASSKMAAELAVKVAKTQDDLITAALNQRLGRSDWELTDLLPRLCRVQILSQPQELWLLDDKPLIEIWPVDLVTVQEGDSAKMKANLRHRSFPTT